MSGLTEMDVRVYDYETLKSHDLVGSTKYYLDGVLNGTVTQAPIEIYHKNKMVGTVYVEFSFMGQTAKMVGNQLLKGMGLL